MHFAILVTDTDSYNLEEQLEPFCEEVDEESPYAEKDYICKKEEVSNWLEKELAKEKQFLNDWKKSSKMQDCLKYTEDRVKHLEKIIKLANIDKQLEEIANYNFGAHYDEKGVYWVYNPNSEYDWWVEGGRWDGWLITKNGKHCNSCKVKDIDFEKIQEARLERIMDNYDSEIARANQLKVKPIFEGFKDTPTREEYLETVKNEKPCTYGILHNGEWETKDTISDWDKRFFEILEDLDPESEVTLVDCHI